MSLEYIVARWLIPLFRIFRWDLSAPFVITLIPLFLILYVEWLLVGLSACVDDSEWDRRINKEECDYQRHHHGIGNIYKSIELFLSSSISLITYDLDFCFAADRMKRSESVLPW